MGGNKAWTRPAADRGDAPETTRTQWPLRVVVGHPMDERLCVLDLEEPRAGIWYSSS
jgi:hypothetical protein